MKKRETQHRNWREEDKDLYAKETEQLAENSRLARKASKNIGECVCIDSTNKSYIKHCRQKLSVLLNNKLN